MSKLLLQRLSVFCVLLLTASTAFSQSQTKVLGGWLNHFGQWRMHEHFSLNWELIYRSQQGFHDPENFELRAFMYYHPVNSFAMGLGVDHEENEAYGTENNKTTRIDNLLFEQFQLDQAAGRVRIQHRYRIEERWLHSLSPQSMTFNLRMRYRIMAAIPLNHKTLEPKTAFLNFFDEVFVQDVKGKVFDRNRVYAGIGYQINRPCSVQLGWLNQQQSAFNKNYLQVILIYNLDSRKAAKPKA
jgi:hypothetical protein